MTTTEQIAVTSTETQAVPDVAKLQTQIEQITAERDKLRVSNRELKSLSDNSSELKKQYDELLTEKSKLAEEFGSFKGIIKQQKLDTHISTALEASGAKSLTAALKLLDRTKIEFGEDDNVKVDSIVLAINELKASEPILFKEVEQDPKKDMSGNTTGFTEPKPKPAAQGNMDKDSYATEISNAKSQKEVEAIMKKYSKA